MRTGIRHERYAHFPTMARSRSRRSQRYANDFQWQAKDMCCQTGSVKCIMLEKHESSMRK